ncbi:hypothetical protein EGW08_012205 [Elysia chlorotica]|uniref:Uncharacterized protein n=1 Tax=Elysia chlorotica TaxID=188477 RepID=A0A433TEP7_ELYCH|nr:hypothetical protein EGW08_012205 [Elysia chlorotica]
MADSGDMPLPPSYDEAIKVPSAPPTGMEQQPYQGQPAYGGQPQYPPYPSGDHPPYPSAGQPPYNASAGQPPYPSAGQPPYNASAGQPPYAAGLQPPYPSTGQPSHVSAGQGTYPYQPTQGQGYGTQPGQVQYSSVAGQPAQYTHQMVSAVPTNVTVNSPGYQTTPQVSTIRYPDN